MLLQQNLAIMESMRTFSKFENWSLIALAGSLALALVLFFAPGHQHVFGDWEDPLSVGMGIMMMTTVIVEVAVLYSLSRRRTR